MVTVITALAWVGATAVLICVGTAAIPLIYAEMTGRSVSVCHMITPGYRTALGDKAGAVRARKVARSLDRAGAKTLFHNALTLTFPAASAWVAAEAIAATISLKIVDGQERNCWLAAFAGPRQDGSLVLTYLPLTSQPRQWAAWVSSVGGREQALAILRAGIGPREATAMMRNGTLDTATVTVMAALR